MIDTFDDIYIFIIWNKVLWCKKRIIDDLQKDFYVEKTINILWDTNKFADNISAFYGVKVADLKRKIKTIGNGKFCLVVVKDIHPEYKIHKVYDRDEYINISIYNKKKIYREWTGTNFRIHSSDNSIETKHDLSVLFGSKALEIVNSVDNNSTLITDSIGVKGFFSEDELLDTLKLFQNNVTIKNEKEIYVFAKNKVNIKKLIKCSDDDVVCNISINGVDTKINIFGEEDGDLPLGFVDLASSNSNVLNDFIKIKSDYFSWLNNRRNDIVDINNFFSKYHFSNSFDRVNTMRKKENISVFDDMKKTFKYLIARIKNNFVS